ncbi:unnamed protein product [Urochloa humidicola]
MAGGNHFALLKSDDPGDTHLDNKNQQEPAANLTAELFGKAYPSAWKIIRTRERQQQNGAGQAKITKDGVAAGGARADKKKGGARKLQGGRDANNGAAVADEAPALRLFDPAQFPSLK